MVGGCSASSSVAAMSVTSGGGGSRARSHQGVGRHHHHHQQQQQQQQQHRTRHHHRHNHPRTMDYNTEHDTDRAPSPRIGQRSQSLSTLQPAVIQPRMAQLETLEAKMASIEVSLSSGTPRRKKCNTTSPSPVSGTRSNGAGNGINNTVQPPLDQLEGFRNALRDKENIIKTLRNGTTDQNGLRNLIGSLQVQKEREVLKETERRHLESRLHRLKTDTENKRLAIKNLKLALDKLDISDNIDIRIQQAELEYQLGREELNLLTLLEETRSVQGWLDESAAAVAAAAAALNNKRNKSGSVHACVTDMGGRARLLALDTNWDANNPRFGTTVRDSGGIWIEWAFEDTGLKKDDRLIEVNGKLVVTRNVNREDLLRLLSASPDPAELVILRADPAQEMNNHILNGNHHYEVSTLRSELGLVRERAEEAQRAKDGLRADNLRLTHRISYLEEQVSELLESRRHRHHNHHQHHRVSTQQEQHVRVVTTTPINNNQNVTNINIGTTDVQVFQKGPQVTALVSSTNSRSLGPVRAPSSPCITASDKYTTTTTTDDEQKSSATDLDTRSTRVDARSVKSLDLDLEPFTPPPINHYAKPRKSLDYTSEPVAVKKRPTPPKKPVRLSLHRAQSLQSVENGVQQPLPEELATTTAAITHSSGSCGMIATSSSSSRKRTHKSERTSVSGLRWPSSVSVHLHQRQTARWC